jgi:hypothetical protein
MTGPKKVLHSWAEGPIKFNDVVAVVAAVVVTASCAAVAVASAAAVAAGGHGGGCGGAAKGKTFLHCVNALSATRYRKQGPATTETKNFKAHGSDRE